MPSQGFQQHDPQKKIERWQIESFVEDNSDALTGIVGSLFDGLTSSLQAVLHSLQKCDPEHPQLRPFERSAAALLFWGSDHGVPSGGLDRALQHSRNIRDTVLLVLISIGDLLSQGVHLILIPPWMAC
jgi:hypothetical protein